jgi:hypothetical protein
MPDVTYLNYPENQYTFSSAELKRTMLAERGCGAAHLFGKHYPAWSNGLRSCANAWAGGCPGPVNGTVKYPRAGNCDQ